LREDVMPLVIIVLSIGLVNAMQKTCRKRCFSSQHLLR